MPRKSAIPQAAEIPVPRAAPTRQHPQELAQHLGTPGESRHPLIPLPAVSQDSPWRRLAEDITRQYRAERAADDKGGRLSHLADTDLVAALLMSIDDGLSPGQAATRCGVHPITMSAWLEAGEKANGTSWANFTAAAKVAKEARRARLLGTIARASDAGPQYWTAGAWLLERPGPWEGEYRLNAGTTAAGISIQIGVLGSVGVKIGGESLPEPQKVMSLTDSHSPEVP